MAQVSSGSFNTSSCEGRYLTFNWSVHSTNTGENYKEIYWSLVGAGVSGYVTCGNFKVVIEGETVYSSANRHDVWNGLVIASGYKKIYHNNDGTKTFSASAEAGIYTYAVNCYGSGSWELPKIPKNAQITSFVVSKRDETSVLYHYNVDAPCDYAWYSTDDGATWHDLPNTNIVSGLTHNTTYKFKLKVRRTSNSLKTESSTYQQTTYNYPHCIDSPDFTIGDPLTLKLYNPLKRYVYIKGYSITRDIEIFSGEGVHQEITGFNDAHSVNLQYESIPSSQSDRYFVVVSYDNKAMSRDAGNIFKIRGNEVPTINAFDYIDNNSDIVAITGDATQILQNKSTLQARFHSATANFGASGITKYRLECNGIVKEGSSAGAYDFGTINSERDVELKLTAYDSRGLSTTKTIPVNMIAYDTPTATVELKRLNNYEDETYLTVNASITILEKNTATIQYRYRSVNGSYGSFITIGDREKQTLSLDKNEEFVFNITVTDVFGSKFDSEYKLSKGIFPLFIDTIKNSVGINCFPKQEKSLEVNGKNLYDFVNKYEKSHKQIYLTSGGGLVISVDEVYGSDKITIIVKGADNVTYKPVYTIIQYRTDGYFDYINLGQAVTVTRKDNNIHINASQWSYYEVSISTGCEISLSNRAL